MEKFRAVENNTLGEVAYLRADPSGKFSKDMRNEIVKESKNQKITYEEAVCHIICGNGECPVCLEPLHASSLAILPCKHQVCLNCMIKVLIGVGENDGDNSCPLCRGNIVDDKVLDEVFPEDYSDDEDIDIDLNDNQEEDENPEEENDEDIEEWIRLMETRNHECDNNVEQEV